tara:strand:- start:3016 stop:4944 length:1929 start_codon:yes stop_codon:yes gene_type:complete
MSAVNFITSLARKLLARESKGITTIPNRMAVESKADEIAATLQNAGIPLNKADEFIKSEQDLVRILNLIESTPPVTREVPSGIRSTESAKVFDMEGKEIPKGSKIMGGKAVKETEEEIAKRLGEENKRAAQRMKNKKLVQDAIDNVSPGFVKGDNKYNAEIVAEEIANQRGLDYYDMDSKQRLDIYDEAFQALTKMTEDFAQGGRAGFFMGSKYPKGLATLRDVLRYMSKKGQDEDKIPLDLSALDMLRMSNPKAFNKMLEDVRGKVLVREGIMGTDAVKAQQKLLEEKRKGLVEKTLDVAKAMKLDQDEVAKRVNKAVEEEMIPNIKATLMKDMNMSEEAAQKMAESMSRAAAGFKLKDAAPELTEEGIMQLENILKDMKTGGKTGRDLNASGGRIGFKDGMTRRTFLKIFAGLASIPIVGKIVKPLKFAKGVKNVPIIKTENVAGKPEWFDSLVNKVIVEGDDVTKRFATGERQSIHQKKLDDGSVVRVTEEMDDGVIRVEYESSENVFGDPVQMQYKKPLPDEGAPDPAAEFTTAESGPVGRSVGPDDYDIDVDEVGGTSIRDLDSDVSKLKEYATGQKPTIKEMMQNKRRRDRAKAITEDIDGEQSDAVIRRQGDADDSYYGDPEELASGGIASMLGE